MVNTRITYEYRDGGNNRFWTDLILVGAMTQESWERIRAACHDGDQFIAEQVGLPDVFGFLPGDHIYAPEYCSTGYPFDQEVDHCWHRLPAEDPWELTREEPTGDLTVALLVNGFEQAAAVGWKVFDPAERFGL
jgi:hypothetical protein